MMIKTCKDNNKHKDYMNLRVRGYEDTRLQANQKR